MIVEDTLQRHYRVVIFIVLIAVVFSPSLILFNFNTNAIGSSSLTNYINSGGTDAAQIRADFGLYNKSKNKTTNKLEVTPGLINRRGDEAGLSLNGDYTIDGQ